MKTPKKVVFHAWQDGDSMRQEKELLPAAAAIHSPLVLIIDDSPTVRKIVEITLQREGYGQLHSFTDGVAALAWLTSPQGRIPALILLDIELPRMSGYEVARWLTQSPAFAQTHIIMLSRRTGIVDRLKARLAGAENYLAKPFTTTQLLTLVERSIGSAPSQELESGTSSPTPARCPLSPIHERWAGSIHRTNKSGSRSLPRLSAKGDLLIMGKIACRGPPASAVRSPFGWASPRQTGNMY